ncbi:helix-turn-helix transcriptional regulator [Aquipuribacter hungaricus]|uniref:Helix-turn-helix transcriptional regulator n=3 Tax=Aquipuribacter hungaricus TaxID=545624 RepID=A0ABV7WEM1_9MICO
MSAQRTERLLNLVIALRATRRGMRREDLRRAVPQYAASPNEAAFERMFERDKEDLREIGVPIVTLASDVLVDAEDAYRIDAGAYELPPVTFTPAEVAVLGLAAHVWQQAALAVPAARALTKLKAVGAADDPLLAAGAGRDLAGLVDPVVRTVEPAFQPLHDALRLGRVVRFSYRRPGAEPVRRTVEPWRLVLRSGTWYLVGLDLDRDAARVFRLSRIEGAVSTVRGRRAGPVPEESVVLDALHVLSAAEAPARDGAEVRRPARLRLRPGRGGRLRAMAVRGGHDPGDGEEVELWLRGGPGEPVSGFVVEAVASAGVDVAVLEPDELRDAVRRQWQGVAAAHEGPVPEGSPPPADDEAPGPVVHGAGATERLSRLLAMVPFVLRREGVTLTELAEHFEVPEKQVVKDLELLFVCGTPGHLPDDLIEADWEGGVVRIGNAEPISRPLRLTSEEAVVLLLGLRLLADVPGPHDRAAVTSAADTLSALTSGQQSPLGLIPDPYGPPTHAATVTTALVQHRRLRLRYLSAGRDELAEREVDPYRIVSDAGRHYLEGWCHRAEQVRLFRLDRVVQAEVLDVPAGRGPAAQPHEPRAPGGQVPHGAADTSVVLRLHRGAHWVAEHYAAVPVVRAGHDAPAPEGALDVRLRVADPERVVRLVLGLGGRAEVLAPGAVRAAVASAAAAALARPAPAGATVGAAGGVPVAGPGGADRHPSG